MKVFFFLKLFLIVIMEYCYDKTLKMLIKDLKDLKKKPSTKVF
jgi:hypothetical protein